MSTYIAVNDLGQGCRTFLREHTTTVHKFSRYPFACPWEFERVKYGLEDFHKLLLIGALLLYN